MSNDIEQFGLKVRNLKCFGEAQGFDTIKPINIIIGRNSVGKSTLLDLVELAVQAKKKPDLSGYRGRNPEFLVSAITDKDMFDKHCSGSQFSTGSCLHLNEFGKQFLLGKPLDWSVFGGNEEEFATKFSKQIIWDERRKYPEQAEKVIVGLIKGLRNPFAGYHCFRMLADRDIKPETVGNAHDPMQELSPFGDNATRLITRYLQQHNLNRSIVEVKIKDELNIIFEPESHFRRIVPQVNQQDEWEIYLEEPNKGLIPMSRTGSGIKTVLLVLLNLYLMPNVLRSTRNNVSQETNKFLFCFEELENNLHPSLQRRLFRYLKNVAERDGCKFFITTHSHVIIDLFSRDENAQIVHVTHDGESASARRVTTYLNHRNIFDDLEVRASDLLQTNAIVWVEGPSDKVYFNKWIELWTGGDLKEHVDYEVVFSAGSLLAHYSFDDPIKEEERIEALRVNRNAIILIDSDKKTSEDEVLKKRAERAYNEVKGMGGVAWITAGKEVENYIPDKAFDMLLETTGVKPRNKFVNVFELIRKNKGGDFSKRKTELAERITKILTKEMIADHLDMGVRLDEVCDKIRVWNNRNKSK